MASDDDRLPWFKCFPTKLLGAYAAMRPDDAHIYTVVLLRQYEIGGPVPDDAAALARRTGFRTQTVSASLDRLIACGKLKLIDGKLANDFAENIIRKRTLRTHNVARQFPNRVDPNSENVNDFNETRSKVGAKLPMTQTQTQNLKLKENLSQEGKGKNDRPPPRHGTVSRTRGTIWLRVGTPDYDAYASDYREHTKTDPEPYRGGFWFSIMGEKKKA